MKDIYLKYKEIINYLVIGVLTTLVSLITYYILVKLFLDASNAIQLQVANVLSWMCAVLFAYFANRKFVFESKNSHKLKEFTSFVTSRILTLLMDMLIMFIGVTVLKFNDKIIKLLVQVIVTIVNYILSKWFVFKK